MMTKMRNQNEYAFWVALEIISLPGLAKVDIEAVVRSCIMSCIKYQ